jgi:cyclase
MEQLARNVFVETRWRGANTTFVVTSEGVVLIDVPPEIDKAKEWAKEIAKHGKLLYIINTELHHDHWLGNSLFEGVAITHDLTMKAMSFMDLDFQRQRTSFMYKEPLYIPDNFELKLPSITFSQNMTLRLGNHTFQLLFTPGHSAGQIAVYIPEEKIAFVGDSIVNGIRTAFHDGITDDRWLASMKLIEDLDTKIIVPGHGDILYDKKYIETQTAVVRGFLAAVKAGKTDGVRMSEAVYRSIDPYYDTLPIGASLEAMLGPSDQAKKTGKHGRVKSVEPW